MAIEVITANDIIKILTSFHFERMDVQKKVEFIESFFKVKIDQVEISPRERLVEIIRVRIMQDNPCPVCNGLGGRLVNGKILDKCEECHGTGKYNIYK